MFCEEDTELSRNFINIFIHVIIWYEDVEKYFVTIVVLVFQKENILSKNMEVITIIHLVTENIASLKTFLHENELFEKIIK